MTSLLSTMRERLAEAESDAERLRAAIQILEQAETSPKVKRARVTTAATPAPVAAAAKAPAAAEPPVAAEPPAAAPRKRNPAPKKAGKAVVPLAKLLKVVGDNPGLTTTTIANQTGGDQSVLLELLKESEQKGDVRRQGQRRATSWYLVTDEDRIAARAAQIAAQATSGGSRRTVKR